MTIKEFAYTAQQNFQAKTGQNIKRTHIYELLADSCGYNSFDDLYQMFVVLKTKTDISL